ncbi:hypothetical protein D3C72_1297600 [compost metagenome]
MVGTLGAARLYPPRWAEWPITLPTGAPDAVRVVAGFVSAADRLADPAGGAVLDPHPHYAGRGAQLAAAGRLRAAAGPAAVPAVWPPVAVARTHPPAGRGLAGDPRGTGAAAPPALDATARFGQRRSGAAGAASGRFHAGARQRGRSADRLRRITAQPDRRHRPGPGPGAPAVLPDVRRRGGRGHRRSPAACRSAWRAVPRAAGCGGRQARPARVQQAAAVT